MNSSRRRDINRVAEVPVDLASRSSLSYRPGVGVVVGRFSSSRLRAAYGSQKLSWDDLAKATGEDRVLLLHWAAGRRKPRLEQLQKLARALGLREADLLDPPPANPTLAELRRESGLTQGAFAERLDIPRSTYAAFESGREQTVSDAQAEDLLTRIARQLDCDVETVKAALDRTIEAQSSEAQSSRTVMAEPTLTQRRHAALRSPLPDDLQRAVPTEAWLRRRCVQLLAAADVAAELVFDADEYEARTGRPADPWRAGEVFRGRGMDVPLLYIRLALLPDNAEADRVITHEVMHLRWPSYGHKQAAFERAQQLLDAVGPAT